MIAPKTLVLQVFMDYICTRDSCSLPKKSIRAADAVVDPKFTHAIPKGIKYYGD
jgi:hypothetical protein